MNKINFAQIMSMKQTRLNYWLFKLYSRGTRAVVK